MKMRAATDICFDLEMQRDGGHEVHQASLQRHGTPCALPVAQIWATRAAAAANPDKNRRSEHRLRVAAAACRTKRRDWPHRAHCTSRANRRCDRWVRYRGGRRCDRWVRYRGLLRMTGRHLRLRAPCMICGPGCVQAGRVCGQKKTLPSRAAQTAPVECLFPASDGFIKRLSFRAACRPPHFIPSARRPCAILRRTQNVF